MPPPTAASKNSGAPCASDSAASSSPCAASIALLAVTTGSPRRSAALTDSKATPSAPPISSTKTSMSRCGGQFDRRRRRSGAPPSSSPRSRLRARAVGRERKPRPARVAESRSPAAAEAARGSSRPRRDRRRPPAAALSSSPRSACRKLNPGVVLPELPSRINEGAARLSPSVRRPTSSSSCAPCARRSGRRARASSRIRAAPAPRAARCVLGLARERLEAQLLLPGGFLGGLAGGLGGGLLGPALGALDVAHDARLENRLPLGLALDHGRVGRDRISALARNFSAIALRALAAAAWRSAKLLPFIKDIAFLERLVVGDAGSCHSAGQISKTDRLHRSTAVGNLVSARTDDADPLHSRRKALLNRRIT